MSSTEIQDILPPKHRTERHLACAIVVDRSGSMSGRPIQELNDSLKLFGIELGKDSMAQGRVDVTVISFASDVKVEMGFRSAEEFVPPSFSANGGTAFNRAINVALDALESRKDEYKATNMTYYRPWLFILTDGYPTDGEYENETKTRLHDFINRNKVVYIPMGIGSANISHLQSYHSPLSEKKPVLKGNDAQAIRDAFCWLSDSIGITSKSDPSLGNIQSAPIPETITLALN